MFIGTSYPKLDDKFRLILPAKFRDRLAGGVVLTKGQENCLVLLTAAEFAARSGSLAGNLPIGSLGSRGLNRHYFHLADEQTPDGQGRILVNSGLREWADLGRDLVVVGVGKHIEIWNPEKHKAFMDATAEAFANFNEGEVTLN
ncbi:MAG: division/cell wall cluster transcriptional repressor MraZ [Actinobacteria bacterium]|uniref:Transcriptional regulator MraZ n=1 Tax=freshwater metagenome TaxID=449393 RepID=A0A6J6N2Q8_9ZZZZ|nr:division/cell wall cluster transcriptional repressor MraZ [Actinomycetota bacterium]